ncbi:AI-2E family transporter [Flavihumibacter fluvii]|uniref:AI-2E family transporter n=1 Tax=Flavihumibacter fluvii TaxID=2838157 RepID=UPI001BDDF12F|nr:AI-2E family transporter [Flavihumibacter fluvii]ULQ52224.1 AI-2E family transporter [Flavihumibacter fluvii]
MAFYDEDKLRQAFFIGIIGLLGIVLFLQLKSFLPAILGAFTLYVLMSKFMDKLVARKWSPALAAAFLMLVSFLVIVVPIGSVIKMLIARLSLSEDQFNHAVSALQVFIKGIEDRTGFELLTDKYVGQLSGFVARELPIVLGATFNTITTIIIMYFILFFMLTQGSEMEDILSQFLPMEKRHRHLVQKEMGTLVLSNAIGIPLIALLQGLIGLVGYLILGVKEPVLWFAITCISAMLPIVGAAAAYIPLTIMFFVAGDNLRGIGMLILGFGFIGMSDNIFRFWLQKKIGNVHPLITVFGVLVGLKLFGFIGLVFGPLLISVFILLIRIYRLEFSHTRFVHEAPLTVDLPPESPPGNTVPASGGQG